MTRDEFGTLIQAMVQGWKQKAYDRVASMFAPDVAYADPTRYASNSRDELLAFFKDDDGREQCVDLHLVLFDPELQVGMVEYTYTGTHRYHGVAVVRVEKGLVTHWREYQHESGKSWAEFVGRTAFSPPLPVPTVRRTPLTGVRPSASAEPPSSNQDPRSVQCPRDAHALVEQRVFRVMGHVCPYCDGCWLTEGKLALLRRTATDLEGVSSHEPPRKTPPIRCPQCKEEMRLRLFSAELGVELDVCPSCRSIWLDTSELKTIVSQGRQG